MGTYSFPSYFESEVLRRRPYLTRDLCILVVRRPIRVEVQVDGRVRFWAILAELDGRVVGHLLLEPEEADLARPPGSIYLAVAATRPEARGRGAGVALTEHALRWAANAGYTAMHTDWRVANLESSRFWPRRGFRETFYRVARRVNIG